MAVGSSALTPPPPTQHSNATLYRSMPETIEVGPQRSLACTVGMPFRLSPRTSEVPHAQDKLANVKWGKAGKGPIDLLRNLCSNFGPSSIKTCYSVVKSDPPPTLPRGIGGCEAEAPNVRSESGSRPASFKLHVHLLSLASDARQK